MLPGNKEDRLPVKGGRTLPSSLKTSICDWDSPSSRTGTVRRKNTKNKMSSSTSQLSTKIPKTSKTASLRKLSPIAGTSGTQSTVKLNLNSNSTNQITELFTDIPDLVNQQHQHKTPPPYKEPPTPPPLSQIPSLNGAAKITKLKQQNNAPSGKVVFGKKERREMNSAGGAIKNCISKLTGSPSKHSNKEKEENIQAKLQNIPVRPRKTSTISKEDNYCLFDPSVDFINEKKQTKVDVHPPCLLIDVEDNSNTTTSPDTSEDIVEEIIYEDSQEIENKDYHNYFIIDPEDMLSENDEEIKVEVDVEETTDVLPLVEQRRKLKFLNLSPMHQNNNSSSSSTSTSTSTSSTSSSSSASLAVGGGASSSFITYKLEKDIRNRTVPLTTYGSPYAVNRNVQYKKSSSKRPQSVHSDADSGFLSPCTPEDFKLNSEILAMEEWNNLQVYVEVGKMKVSFVVYCPYFVFFDDGF